MRWIVVQTDRVSHLKLYACFTNDLVSAWTGDPKDAFSYKIREAAEQEKAIREHKGWHLRGWSLHLEEVA